MSETVFTYGAPGLKFGEGASDEIGHDLSQYDVQRVLVITDPGVAATGHPQRVADQMGQFGIEAAVFDGVHVEPTDASLEEAIAHARDTGPWDAFVAVGGGSSIDTAKAVDLLMTNDGELMDYVNAPVGKGRNPEQPLKPLVAVPTTTGTGAESTTICVLDVLAQTRQDRDQPPAAAAHAGRRRPGADPHPAGGRHLGRREWTSCATRSRATPRDRSPPSSASSPSSGCPTAGRTRSPTCGRSRRCRCWPSSFRRAVHHGDDPQARHEMALAATFAGLGFGNAGVHIPHANAYPIAGRVKDFRPDGYPEDEPIVPHGMAVSLTAPEAFRWTFEASPERHLRSAELLAPGHDYDGPDALPAVLTDLMRDIAIPNGLGAVGYDKDDVDDLVEGTMKQQRLLATAPREVTEDDAAGILTRSLELW